MRHWCHCFSSVSIFIVLRNPSRKLFLRSSMAGNSFGLFPSDRCLQMSETATRAERRLQNIPILMETHDSRKQQEFRDFSVLTCCKWNYCQSSCFYIKSRLCLFFFFSYFYSTLWFISASLVTTENSRLTVHLVIWQKRRMMKSGGRAHPLQLLSSCSSPLSSLPLCQVVAVMENSCNYNYFVIYLWLIWAFLTWRLWKL